MQPEEQLVPGDIVQITDPFHPWFSCLLIVTEVKSWGIQGYVSIPMSNDGKIPASSAFNRLNYERITKVGHTILHRHAEEI